ncbi:NAD(P)/FAD-dependent oxidoreductase [Candidatus Woesearchaeota archaeon]|nr:NAD(P)/FAD-dependent oxidoreductase [Candidatus Woesearchaeota archaeon]
MLKQNMIMIIGSGSAGSFLGLKLARHGFNVHVIEQQGNAGGFQKDTGLVSNYITNVLEANNLQLPRKLVINKLYNYVIHGLNKQVLISLKNPDFLIDSYAFDNWLYEKAYDYGVVFAFNTRFQNIQQGKVVLKDLKNKKVYKIKPSILIAADGVNSNVAKQVKLYGDRVLYQGLEFTVKTTLFKDSNTVHVYPYYELLAWVVPESETIARVGLIAKTAGLKALQRFLKHLNIYNVKVLQKRAGLVCLYNPKQAWVSNTGRTLLLGDAALQMKATSFGGIVQGLKAAQHLANALKLGKPVMYGKLAKPLRRELYMHLVIRKFWNSVPLKKWDLIIQLLKDNKALVEVLSKHSRDNIASLVLQALKNSPKLLNMKNLATILNLTK